MTFSILYPLLLLIPLAVLHLVFKSIDRARAAKALVAPVGEDEKFLRSPGDSMFKWKRQLDEQFLENLLLILTTPAFFLTAYLSARMNSKPSTSFWISWGLFSAVYLGFLVKAFRKLRHLYDDREIKNLGFRGERAVGEYLNQLMLHGCRVFHDFPLNGDGNLDHIVVAPSGVYAIETKAKSKLSGRPEDGTMRFDGEELTFPGGAWDVSDLKQSARQAAQLHDELLNKLKINVWVDAVLVFPGWEINRTRHGIVKVLTHTELRDEIVGGNRRLTPYAIRKISAYLDTRCRDVAF